MLARLKNLMYVVSLAFMALYAFGVRYTLFTLDPSTVETINALHLGKILTWGLGTDLFLTIGLPLAIVSSVLLALRFHTWWEGRKIVTQVFKSGNITKDDIAYLKSTWPLLTASFIALKQAAYARDMVETLQKVKSAMFYKWEERLFYTPTKGRVDMLRQLLSGEGSVTSSNPEHSGEPFHWDDPKVVLWLVLAAVGISLLILLERILSNPRVWLPIIGSLGVAGYYGYTLFTSPLKAGKTQTTLPEKGKRVGIVFGVCLLVFLLVGMILPSLLAPASDLVTVAPATEVSPAVTQEYSAPFFVEKPEILTSASVSNTITTGVIDPRVLNVFTSEPLSVIAALNEAIKILNVDIKNLVDTSKPTLLTMDTLALGIDGKGGVAQGQNDVECWVRTANECTLSDGTVMPMENFPTRVMQQAASSSITSEDTASLSQLSSYLYDAWSLLETLVNKLWVAGLEYQKAKDPNIAGTQASKIEALALANKMWLEAYVTQTQLNLLIEISINPLAAKLNLPTVSKLEDVVTLLKTAAENNRGGVQIEYTATPSSATAVNPLTLLVTPTAEAFTNPPPSSTSVCDMSDAAFNAVFASWEATGYATGYSYSVWSPCGGIEANKFRVDYYLVDGSHFWVFSSTAPDNISPNQKFKVVPGPGATDGFLHVGPMCPSDPICPQAVPLP